MASIGLGEALSLWLGGHTLDDLAIYGVPTLWLARGAKIATYAAGLVVILDIVGPSKVQGYVRRGVSDRAGMRYSLVMIVLLTPVAWFLLTTHGFTPVGHVAKTIALAAIAFVLLVALVSYFALGVLKVLQTDRTALVMRIASLFVLSVSFLVDLLTS